MAALEKKDANGDTYLRAPPPNQPFQVTQRHVAAWTAISSLIWLIIFSGHIYEKYWSNAGARDDRPVHGTAKPFSWDTIATRSYLDYTPCLGDHQCARLELPMDYWNGTTNATISLAVIRKPAVVPITSPLYGGAIITNPGGPGGSGVSFLANAGDGLRAVLDAEDEKYYDLLSFDPRGVGQSTPLIRCFSDTTYDYAWNLRLLEEGWFESSDASLGRLWSMADAKGQSCTQSLTSGADKSNIKKFVTTASVARDMLELVEKHGYWRVMEEHRLLTEANSKYSVVDSLRSYQSSEENIQYIGFSYGTYLGSTFAAMFPERVHRLVLDGVVHANNYRKALWSDNLIDTEKTMSAFYHHCARVGYPRCALAQPGKATAEAVESRVLNITKSLYHNPLPVVGPNPEVITYSDVRGLVFMALYTPITAFPRIANLLAQVEQGDGSTFAQLLLPTHIFDCKADSSAPSPLYSDALMGIACTDGDDVTYVNKTTFLDREQELAESSPTAGSLWARVHLNCIHYPLRAHHRFPGPWKGNTRHPVLFIGNTADPVTPGLYAVNMAKGYEGAVALIQDSAGHCAIATTRSKCTTGYTREYFKSGKMPPVNTTCTADEMPFGPDEIVVESGEAKVSRERHASIGAALMKFGGLGNMLPMKAAMDRLSEL